MAPWLQLFRIRLLPTALSNLLVGITAVAAARPAGDPIDWVALPLWQAGVLAAFLYMFGMGLNDWRDRARDARIHPERPLPSGAIAPATALTVLGLLAAGSLGLAFTLGTAVLVTTASLLAAILLYDLLLKDVPILAPAAMGSVRGILICLGGAVASGEAFHPHCAFPAVIVGTYVALLTHFSMEEERAREAVLRRRLLAISLPPALAPAVLFFGDIPGADLSANPLRVAVWALPLVWLLVFAAAPLRSRPPRPGLVTFRSLLGLFALDVALLLSYASPRPTLVTVFLLLLAMSGRSRKAASPATNR